jgi:bacteriocin-like protein
MQTKNESERKLSKNELSEEELNQVTGGGIGLNYTSPIFIVRTAKGRHNRAGVALSFIAITPAPLSRKGLGADGAIPIKPAVHDGVSALLARRRDQEARRRTKAAARS